MKITIVSVCMDSNNYKLMFFLAVSLIVSGCIVMESEDSDRAVTCSAMHLTVIDADGAQAEVANLGRAGFGNVTATWTYYHTDTVVKEFVTPTGGERSVYESGEVSRLESFTVQHQDCPSRRSTYS